MLSAGLGDEYSLVSSRSYKYYLSVIIIMPCWYINNFVAIRSSVQISQHKHLCNHMLCCPAVAKCAYKCLICTEFVTSVLSENALLLYASIIREYHPRVIIRSKTFFLSCQLWAAWVVLLLLLHLLAGCWHVSPWYCCHCHCCKTYNRLPYGFQRSYRNF